MILLKSKGMIIHDCAKKKNQTNLYLSKYLNKYVLHLIMLSGSLFMYTGLKRDNWNTRYFFSSERQSFRFGQVPGLQ